MSRIAGLLKTPHRIFVLLLIIAIPTFASILNASYFPIHDDQSVARLFLLDQGLQQGVIYPRWVGILGFGFGYPLFNFYPPLVYYLGELFHVLGASYIWSIKLVMITGFILSAVGMYLLARKYLSSLAAVTGSVLYTYFTYHAVVAYVRGALAEFFTFAVLPFVFLAIINLAEKPTIKRAAYFGVALAALILTHPLIAFPSVFYIAFFFLYYFLVKKEKSTLVLQGVFGGILGLSLSAFFWLPSLLEKKFTLTDSILTKELASYSIHFLYPMQLYFSQWGYGGSVVGAYDGMSFQLGKVHIGLTVLSLGLAALFFLKKSKISLRDFLFVLFLLVFSLFMSLGYSSFIWDKVQFLWFLQFPWRFLTFAGVFIALIGAYSVDFIAQLLPKKNLVVVLFAVLISIAAMGTYQKYFKPQSYLAVSDAQKTSYEEIAWRVSRSSFEFAPQGVVTKKSELNTTIIDIDKKDVSPQSFQQNKALQVKELRNEFAKKEFTVFAEQATQFRLHTFNFPGWKAYLDGREVSITDNNKYKLITVTVPQGDHSLLFRFEDTPVRMFANILSIASFIVLLVLLRKKTT